MNVSLALVPFFVIVCRLTSCLRTCARAPGSASLLCKGSSGYFNTSKGCVLLTFVFEIRSSKACYFVLTKNNLSNSADNISAIREPGFSLNFNGWSVC